MVLLRLPYAWTPAGADESGYLIVARQWHAGGTSLYGSFWVDRPPLLLMVFQAASALGGDPALRVLGGLAAAVTVLAAAAAARRVAGARAASWGAVLTAALLVSPLTGSTGVDGELLAAPFTAVAVASAVAAVDGVPTRLTRWAAFGAGASACAALLVKQNMADAAVFALVSWVVAWRTQVVSGRRLRRMVPEAMSGALATAGLVAGWTLAHGTSLLGVYDAMYPFRIRAARVIVQHSSPEAVVRLDRLLETWARSGVPVLMLMFVWAVLGRRLRGPAAWGLLAALCYATTSVLSGGSYWSHYLVEVITPVAVATALLVGRRARAAHLVSAVAVVVSLVAWGMDVVSKEPSPGTVVGTSIARSARAGDTVTAAFGNADIVWSSGLRSSYPYLWSLPAHTLDPKLDRLRRVLAGPAAPTWVVVENRKTLVLVQAAGAGATLRSAYNRVGRVCGSTVFLHDGMTRPPLRSLAHCRAGLSPMATTWERVELSVDGARS